MERQNQRKPSFESPEGPPQQTLFLDSPVPSDEREDQEKHQQADILSIPDSSPEEKAGEDPGHEATNLGLQSKKEIEGQTENTVIKHGGTSIESVLGSEQIREIDENEEDVKEPDIISEDRMDEENHESKGGDRTEEKEVVSIQDDDEPPQEAIQSTLVVEETYQVEPEIVAIDDDDDEDVKIKTTKTVVTKEIIIDLEDDEPQEIERKEDQNKNEKGENIARNQGTGTPLLEESSEEQKQEDSINPSIEGEQDQLEAMETEENKGAEGVEKGEGVEQGEGGEGERILQPEARDERNLEEELSIQVSKEDENEADKNQDLEVEQVEEEKESLIESESEKPAGEEKLCQICYSKVSKKFLHSEVKHLFDFIHCTKCDTAVHHICHGIDTPITEKVDQDTEKKIKNFLCRRCENPTGKHKCHVCNSEEGYLFPSGNAKWIHILCAISSPTIRFKDVMKMVVDLTYFKKDTINIRTVRKCAICEVKVGTFRCNNENRVRHCHLNCVLRNAALKPEKNGWKINFAICPKDNFVLQQEIDEEDVIDNIKDLTFSLKESMEGAGQGREFGKLEKKNKKAARAARKSANEKKKEKKKQKGEAGVDEVVLEVFNKTKRVIDEEYEEELLEKGVEKKNIDEFTKHMGGKLVIIYQDEDEQGQEEMEIEESKDKSLTEKQKVALIKSLYKEIADPNILSEEFQEEDGLRRFRGNLPNLPRLENLSFPEVLFFVNVFQRRIDSAFQNLCSFEDLKSVMEFGCMLPFAINGLLMPAFEKYFTGLAADILLKPIIENCKPESAYRPNARKFDYEIMRKNHNSIEQAQDIQNIYLEDPCQVVTPSLQKVSKYIEQLSFLEGFYQEVAEYFNEVDRSPSKSRGGSTKGTPLKGSVLKTSSKDNLPNVPLSRMILLYTKALEVELSPELQELKLLELYSSKSKNIKAIVEEQLEIKQDMERGSRSPSLENLEPIESPKPKRSKVESPSKMETEKEDYIIQKKDGKVSIVSKKSVGKASAGFLTVPGKGTVGNTSIGKASIAFSKADLRSPSKASVITKGRLMKNDKAWNEIETEFQIEVRLLYERPTLEEAQYNLEDIKQAGGRYAEEDDLEKRIQKVYRWRDNFLDAVERNDGDLGRLLAEIEHIGIRIDEMERALEYKRDWKLWRIKVISVSRRIRKKVDDIFQNRDEMISLEEIRNVVDEGNSLIFVEADDGFFEELKIKLENALKLGELLKAGRDENEETLQLTRLNEIEKELRNINVNIPEIDILKEKLEINRNIQNLLEEDFSIEELENKAQELTWSFDVADQGLIEAVKRKISTGKKIQAQAENIILTKTKYNIEDLTHMALLCREAKVEKLKIAETDQLMKILQNFLIFQNAYATVIGANPIEMENLENGEYLNAEGRQIEEILEEAEGTIEGVGELDNQKLSKLKEICDGVNIKDIQPFENFFERLLTLIWKENAKNLLKSEAHKSSKDIEKLRSNMPQLIATNEEDADFFKRIQEESQKIVEWKDAVQELLNTNPKEELADIIEKANAESADSEELRNRIDEIKLKIIQLQTWYTNDLSSYTDLGEENRTLQTLLRWTIWIFEGFEMIKQIEKNQRPLSYDKLKASMEEITDLGLPKDAGICKKIAEWYIKAEEVKREYTREYQQKKVKANSYEVETIKAAKLVEKNAAKMTLNDGHAMSHLLRSLSRVVFLAQEIETINFDIQSCEEWSSKVKEAFETFNDVLDVHEPEEGGRRNPLAIREDEIGKVLKELKIQMVELALRNDKSENDLVVFEWTCEAAFLLNKMRKESGYEDWKKHLRVGEKLETKENKKVERFLQILKHEVLKADKIRDFLEKIKKLHEEFQQEKEVESSQKNKLSFDTVQEIMESFDECKIPLREEKKDLEKFYNKCKTIKDRTNKILHPEGERSVLREFTSLQEHIRKLPIDMFKEYKQLDDAIVEANKLDSEAKKQLWDNFKSMEELVKKYKKCPVFINGIAKMEKAYEEAKTGYEKVKKKEAEILSNESTRLSYEELTDLGIEIDNLEQYKIDSALKKLKKHIFVKKCNKLQSQSRDTFIKPSTTIPYVGLKSLLMEGHNLKKQFGDDSQVTTCIHFIDSLLREAEKKIRDIEKEKDAEKLENMPKTILGFVDITQPIIERKASLTTVHVQTQDLHFIDYKADKEKLEQKEREKEQPKKKRGRPRKGEERSPKKDKSSRERTRKSKEKSREKEKSHSMQRKISSSQKKSWVRSSPPREKPMNKLTKYYEPQRESGIHKDWPKVTPKETDAVVIGIKNVLESYGEILKLNYSDSFKYAKLLVEYFPSIVASGEEYVQFKNRLRRVLRYPYVARSISQKQFDKAFLRNMLGKDDLELKVVEGNLKERARNLSAKSKTEDDTLPTAIKKKNKEIPQKDVREGSQRPVQKDKERSSSPFPGLRQADESKKRIEETKVSRPIRSPPKEERTPLFPDRKTSILNKKDDERTNKEKKPTIPETKAPERRTHEEETPFSRRQTTAKASETDKFGSQKSNFEESKYEKQSLSKILEPNAYQIRKKPKSAALYDPLSAIAEPDYGTTVEPYDVPEEIKPEKMDKTERIERLNRLESKKTQAEKEVKPTPKTPTVERGTILRIFDGAFEYEKDKPCSTAELFTCDDFDVVSKIPHLGEDTLKVQKIVPKTQVETYLNSIFNSWEERSVLLISGWVEFRVSVYQSRCDRIAKELFDSDQMCTISYHESSRIIFMHKNQMPNEWKMKLEFRLRKVQKESNPTLYFIIVTKPHKITPNTKLITPVIETATPKETAKPVKEPLFSEKSSKEKTKGDSHSDLSSIEDYEPNFGAEINDKESVPSLDEELEDISNKRKPKDLFDSDRKSWGGSDRNFGSKKSRYQVEREEEEPRNTRMDRGNPRFNNNQKRRFSEMERRDRDRDQSSDMEYDPTKKVKKNSLGDESDIIQKLTGMDNDQIVEFAKNLSQEERMQIMKVLEKMAPKDSEESPQKEDSFVEETALYPESERNMLELKKQREEHLKNRYNPPPYIKPIYNLFDRDQLSQAKRNTYSDLQYQPNQPFSSNLPYQYQSTSQFQSQPSQFTSGLQVTYAETSKPTFTPLLSQPIGQKNEGGNLGTSGNTGANTARSTPNQKNNARNQQNNTAFNPNNKPNTNRFQNFRQSHASQQNIGNNQPQNFKPTTSYNQQKGNFQGRKQYQPNNQKSSNFNKGSQVRGEDVKINLPENFSLEDMTKQLGIQMVGNDLKIPKNLLEQMPSLLNQLQNAQNQGGSSSGLQNRPGGGREVNNVLQSDDSTFRSFFKEVSIKQQQQKEGGNTINVQSAQQNLSLLETPLLALSSMSQNNNKL